MSTRSSANWTSEPGSFDTTKSALQFPSSNCWGIPELAPVPHSKRPQYLIPYRQRIRSDVRPDDGAVHFFLDDYRFESTWSAPDKALRYLSQFDTALTPDFSLFTDMPLAAQLWNTYRNRWCGCYWQSLGKTVIPTVSWSSGKSYNFCFLGIPTKSIVAVGATGLRDPISQVLFREGYREMIRQLQPSAILVYGDLPDHTLGKHIPTYCYPTYWTNIRKARAHGRTW